MPYKSPDQVAEKVKGTSKLSEKKRRQFMNVFNSCWKKTPDDAKCHAMAWGVVKKSAAQVMTEEKYLESKGFGMAALGEPALHRYPRRPSKRTQRDIKKMVLKDQANWQRNRDRLREEYRQKVIDGEIRPPRRVERLLSTARGYPDRDDVQAARRILRKMGLWDDSAERDADKRFASSSDSLEEAISILERMYGVGWDGDRFHAQTFSGVSHSPDYHECDQVPSGLTAAEDEAAEG